MRGGMMRLAIGVALTVCCVSARAEDSSLKEEIADLKARIGALDAATATPAAGGDAESLTSIKKTGAIKIGGDVRMDLIYKRRDDGSTACAGDTVDSTEFHTNGANLFFQVNAAKNMYLYIKLDLDDAWNERGNQDDLLEECRFVFANIRQSNWDIVFGKGEAPYGQDKSLGVIQSYCHNADQTYSSEGPIFLLAGTEEADTTNGNPHVDVGRTAHPGEIDNVFMVEASFNWREKLKLELAVFQNNDTTGNGGLTRGMHEDRSDDTLFFQSLAARAWFEPTENLRFCLSAVKMHDDSAGDKRLAGKLAEADQYAVSAGFDYKCTKLPIELFGEYQRGWDWNYTDGYDTDTVQLGLVVTPINRLDLWVVGEWLGIDDDGNNADEDYLRAVVGAKYTMDSGIYFVLEYAHEWWDGDYSTTADREAEADMAAFRTGFTF